jgi:GTP-binding protein
MSKPVVAIVGRPNVGKSTIFNRLAGERLAIVDDTPGTTRDRLFADGLWNGVHFHLIDTGGIDPSSAGQKDPLSVGSADYITQIRQQALLAVRDADAVLLVVNALDGVTPADQEIAQILRKNQVKRDGKPFPPILLVVNKADNQQLRDQFVDFYKLGMGEPYPISAIHGTNTGEMLDALTAILPKNIEEPEDLSIKIAIVGKPNVGKSSLLNRLTGEERAIVSPIAGTTRDATDTPIEFEGQPVTLIDTAGMRKRGSILPGVEKYSVIRTLKAIERCDVALLMIDATSPISAQDLHIGGFVKDAWKSTILLVNKWDAVEKDNFTMETFTATLRRALDFMDYVPILFISAKTGQRVDQVLPLALKVQAERLVRVTTSQLNRILRNAQDLHAPTSRTGDILKIYYGAEVKTDPPTFLLHVNNPKLGHFTYLRYLENQLRLQYPFSGTPVHFILRARPR